MHIMNHIFHLSVVIGLRLSLQVVIIIKIQQAIHGGVTEPSWK